MLRYLQCCSVDESPKGAQNQEAAEAEDEDLTFVGDIPEFAPEQHPMRGIVVVSNIKYKLIYGK